MSRAERRTRSANGVARQCHHVVGCGDVHAPAVGADGHGLGAGQARGGAGTCLVGRRLVELVAQAAAGPGHRTRRAVDDGRVRAAGWDEQ